MLNGSTLTKLIKEKLKIILLPKSSQILFSNKLWNIVCVTFDGQNCIMFLEFLVNF